MINSSFKRFLDSMRPVLLAATAVGIIVALLAWHGGLADLYIASLASATFLVMLCLCGQITIAIYEGRIGLDIIALLSMGSALTFGEYLAASVVALMYASGQYLESFAEGRAQREMTALLEHAPRNAIRRSNDKLEVIPIDAISVGDLLVVRRGDTVPVDGIADADVTLNEAALTGEPFPVNRAKGENIRSGASNAGDMFGMAATKTAAESTYAGIVNLVEAAHQSRSPMSRLADRYALLFLVMTIAIASGAWLWSGNPINAVAVLVVATPCPLILAVPIAWTAGMSRAAKAGILVKGADVLEKLGSVKTLVLDKTGTLTAGHPTLSRIDAEISENELLRLVASLDQGSSHVAAKAIVDEAQSRKLQLSPPTDVSERPGEGISGTVDGRLVALGSPAYIGSRWAQPIPDPARQDAMAAAVVVDGTYAGTLLFSDPLRAGAREALAALRKLGLSRMILATGDRLMVAAALAKGLDLDEVRAGLSPEEKIDLVRREAAQASVMMIGDGINDAPALAAADVGLAMGVHGAAAAVESADAVLLVERLDRLCDGIAIARDCRTIATQSILAGIGLSVAGMMVAAAGGLRPIEGAILQEAIDVAVVLNALRALRLGESHGKTVEAPSKEIQGFSQ